MDKGMIYPQNFEDKIGFGTIKEMLNNFCLSSLGQERVEEISFCTELGKVQSELSKGDEFLRIFQIEAGFPEMNFTDLRPALDRIRVEGTWMDEAELTALRHSLDSLQRVISFFIHPEDEEFVSPYPHLAAEAASTTAFPEIVREIDRIIDIRTGQMADHASPELAAIRKKLSITTASVSRRLHILLKQAQDEGYVEKGLSPSVRDGRLVIPVSPAFKRKINGIVHDESASGKTVFVEPAELVEANNQIRELENEEKREIVRILTLLADRIRPMVPDIRVAHRFMGEMDFSQAKARLAQTLGAISPIVEDKSVINWQGATHPLLKLSLQKQTDAEGKPKQVVPLNIRLDDRDRILLISGPNAGGKSVCLKTVGLLQYMLQCGLMIPLLESSTCGLFKNIFIDIGDEQSIENDLSTYSSHLLNIKHFLKHSDRRSLLLIDEFGSGTEPKIGGAIAQAALGQLNRQKVMGVITTHYDNLKHFAEDQEGIVNGAMLYDRHLMQALFRLEIGRPGSSFAVEIARKIGLPETIIKEASDLVGSDYIDMDKHLQDIVRDKRYWEQKRQQVKQLEKDLERLTAQYDADLADVKAQRKEILQNARNEARQLLDDTNAQIENTIRGIRESQAEKEKTKALRKGLSEFKEGALNEAANAEEQARIEARIEARKAREKGRMRMPKSQEEKLLRKIRQQNAKEAASPKAQPKPVIELKVGDTVRIKGQESVGTLVEIKGKKALVTFGSVRSRVELDRLEKGKPKVSYNEPQEKFRLLGARTSEEVHRISQQFHQEIDMRGMRADEALQALKYYIDDAVVVGAAKVRILHGTGTGALRQLVREYLKSVPEVSDFHDEHVQLGGAGITVVEF